MLSGTDEFRVVSGSDYERPVEETEDEMHPEMMQVLNELHIQELHRGAARHRLAYPRNTIRRFRGRATRRTAAQSKRPLECGTNA
jgi:hypothetical protein